MYQYKLQASFYQRMPVFFSDWSCSGNCSGSDSGSGSGCYSGCYFGYDSDCCSGSCSGYSLKIPPFLLLRYDRFGSLPTFSGFILWFEYQAADQSGNHCGCNAAGCCLQSAGKYAEETVFGDGLLDTIRQSKSKTS